MFLAFYKLLFAYFTLQGWLTQKLSQPLDGQILINFVRYQKARSKQDSYRMIG